MSAIVKAVLTGTLGLLLKKSRQSLAEKLKNGDATDQQLRSWIIEEFDNVNSKLDALSRKDLKASLSFFKEGVVFLPINKVMDSEASAVETSMGKSAEKMELSASAAVITTSLVEGLRKGRKGGTNTAIPHMVAREYRNTASKFSQIPKPQLQMGKS